MTTPASPSGEIRHLTIWLKSLEPALTATLAEADLDQAAQVGGLLQQASAALTTLVEIATRDVARRVQPGTTETASGWTVSRRGGEASGWKNIDRDRLEDIAVKRATDRALEKLGGNVTDPVRVAELAARNALACVSSSWRLPGLRALNLDMADFAERSFSGVKVVITETETGT